MNKYKLHFTIYISKVTSSFTHLQLDELVKKSENNNRKKGISGYLFFSDGYFLQYIESFNSHEMASLIKVLNSDKRHDIINLFSASETIEKRFTDWSMGWINKQQLIDLNLENKIIDYMQWLSKDTDVSQFNSSRIWGLVDTLASHKKQLEFLRDKV